MLIFNIYNALNLKAKIYSINNANFGYIIILPIITLVQKILLHTGEQQDKHIVNIKSEYQKYCIFVSLTTSF